MRPAVMVSAFPLRSHEDFHGPPFLTRIGTRRLTWQPHWLALTAICIHWLEAESIVERFDVVRSLIDRLGANPDLGQTYKGFTGCMQRHGRTTLDILRLHLRHEVKHRAGAMWKVNGYVPMAVDGTRFDCPRTISNEDAFGLAGKDKTHPQQFVTTLLHLPTSLPWDWRQGEGRDSERTQLRDMLDDLPDETLLIADAGFTGYELLSELDERGVAFIVRVGANTTLYTQLRSARESRSVGYIWPMKYRNHPPLPVRLVRANGVWLVTNVPRKRMSNRRILSIYRMRWTIETHHRDLKQTMGRRRLRSASGDNCRLELEWAIVAMVMLRLLARRVRSAFSLARVLRAFRGILRCPRTAPSLTRIVRHAPPDPYQRTCSKSSYEPRAKKRTKPPSPPNIVKADQHMQQHATRWFTA